MASVKILVTGASGTVGQYVVGSLLEMGESIVAAGTDLKRLQRMFGEQVEHVVFDFTKPETFEAALVDVDRVFLMRPPHLGKPEDLYPFIDCAKGHGIRLISFLSLMGVENNTVPPHHKIEKYIEGSGIPYAHIRPGFFMQNVSGIHAVEIKEKGEICIPAGKSKTSFIDAADVGLAVATVLHEADRYQNTAHTITGPESLDYDQIAEILSDVTGRQITYTKPGFLTYRRIYVNQRGLDKDYVYVTMALYLMTRMGTAKKVTDDFTQLTGKAARTFKAFAEEHRACFIE